MFSIWIPQLAAFLAALVVAYAAKKGLTLETEATTAFFVGTFVTVEKLVSRKTNPGNVAAPELVDAPKVEAEHIRAASKARRSRGI